MKVRLLSALFAPVLVIGMSACTVDQEEEGELPDVEVEGGSLPEYDVDAADVDVNWDTTTVRTPDIDVNRPGRDTTTTPRR